MSVEECAWRYMLARSCRCRVEVCTDSTEVQVPSTSAVTVPSAYLVKCIRFADLMLRHVPSQQSQRQLTTARHVRMLFKCVGHVVVVRRICVMSEPNLGQSCAGRSGVVFLPLPRSAYPYQWCLFVRPIFSITVQVHLAIWPTLGG